MNNASLSFYRIFTNQSISANLIQWCRHHPGLIVIFLLIAVETLRLGAIGMVNRTPISYLQALIGTVGFWLFWIVSYRHVKAAVQNISIGKSAHVVKSVLAVIIFTLLGLSWGMVSDYFLVPGTPDMDKILLPRLLYDFPTLLSVNLVLMAIYRNQTKSVKAINTENKKDPNGLQKVSMYKVKAGNDFHFVALKDIVAVEAQDYYSKLVTQNGSFLLRASLKSVFADLNSYGFIQLSRSAIVKQSLISGMRKDSAGNSMVVLNNSKTYKVSQSKLKSLKQWQNKIAK